MFQVFAGWIFAMMLLRSFPVSWFWVFAHVLTTLRHSHLNNISCHYNWWLLAALHALSCIWHYFVLLEFQNWVSNVSFCPLHYIVLPGILDYVFIIFLFCHAIRFRIQFNSLYRVWCSLKVWKELLLLLSLKAFGCSISLLMVTFLATNTMRLRTLRRPY